MDDFSRRKFLQKAAWAVPAAAIAAPAQADAVPGSGQEKLKVIVTGGHPGDPEYGCGGTVARYTDLGHEVALLYLNKGEWTDKPGYDPGPVRVGEATKACELLKARQIGRASCRERVQ